MFASTEITGVDKILASTKSSRQKKSPVNKNLASTKSSRRQKSCVDKNLAATNVGADTEESPYCLAQQSPQQLTSPRPCWRSLTSPRKCWFPLMQSAVLALAAPLLWADSLPYRTGLLYRPAMQKKSQILAQTKYWCPPKFHWFSPNYTSLYICSQESCKKLVKTKSDHHHCLI